MSFLPFTVADAWTKSESYSQSQVDTLLLQGYRLKGVPNRVTASGTYTKPSDVPGALPSTNRTARIPTDYPTLQAAFDGEKARAYNNFLVEIRLDAGHVHYRPCCGCSLLLCTGLQANGGSYAYARGADFTFAAQNGNTGAAITAWGSIVDCETANCDDSAYYGVQAAHGGIVNFRLGTARRATRYGVRSTDAGLLDFDGGVASSSGRTGIYAFNASHVNAVNAIAYSTRLRHSMHDAFACERC